MATHVTIWPDFSSPEGNKFPSSPSKFHVKPHNDDAGAQGADPEFKDKYRWRAGIEATMSEYDRITGVKRLRVRSFPAVRYCAKLKAIGVKLFRATAVRNARKGQERRPPQPGDSLLYRLILLVKEQIRMVWEKLKRIVSPFPSPWRPDRCYMAI